MYFSSSGYYWCSLTWAMNENICSYLQVQQKKGNNFLGDFWLLWYVVKCDVWDWIYQTTLKVNKQTTNNKNTQTHVHTNKTQNTNPPKKQNEQQQKTKHGFISQTLFMSYFLDALLYHKPTSVNGITSSINLDSCSSSSFTDVWNEAETRDEELLPKTQTLSLWKYLEGRFCKQWDFISPVANLMWLAERNLQNDDPNLFTNFCSCRLPEWSRVGQAFLRQMIYTQKKQTSLKTRNFIFIYIWDRFIN